MQRQGENGLIIIRQSGRLANQMFQLMLATELRNRTGKPVPVVGFDMPEWQLVSPSFTKPAGGSLALKRHVFDLDTAAYLLGSGLVPCIEIEGWGMRLEYYKGPANFRPLFGSALTPATRLSDGELLINVRLEDIMSGRHPKYFPLPFDFYQRVLDETGLKPVFMGQLEENAYVAALRAHFPGARFLPPGTVIEDFERIRGARHVVLSISSFSWLAAWLSETAETIHLPVSGLFDPRNRETMLVPVDDPRYRFYRMHFPGMEERKTLDLVTWAKSASGIRALSGADARKLVLEQYIKGPAVS